MNTMMPLLIGFLTASFVLLLGVYFALNNKTKKVKLGSLDFMDKAGMNINSALDDILIEESIMKKETELNFLQRKERQLNHSGVGINLITYMTILTLSMIGIFVATLKISQSVLIASLVCLTGMAIPEQVVKNRIKKNITSFNNQLVKALRRMASNMRAGNTLQQALDDVSKSKSMPLMIRVEFSKVLSDIKYNQPIERALYNLYERVGSKDVQYLAVAIEIQRLHGGNMAQTFDSIGYNIGNRNIMDGEIRATLAQAKISAKFLSALPIIIFVVLSVINKEFFAPMYDTFIGRAVLMLCFVLIGTGMFVMGKMADIDY